MICNNCHSPTVSQWDVRFFLSFLGFGLVNITKLGTLLSEFQNIPERLLHLQLPEGYTQLMSTNQLLISLINKPQFITWSKLNHRVNKYGSTRSFLSTSAFYPKVIFHETWVLTCPRYSPSEALPPGVTFQPEIGLDWAADPPDTAWSKSAMEHWWTLPASESLKAARVCLHGKILL